MRRPGAPLAHVQVSLGGGDGQDDTMTDDDGKFDLRSTSPERDSLVVTRTLSRTSSQRDQHEAPSVPQELRTIFYLYLWSFVSASIWSRPMGLGRHRPGAS